MHSGFMRSHLVRRLAGVTSAALLAVGLTATPVAASESVAGGLDGSTPAATEPTVAVLEPGEVWRATGEVPEDSDISPMLVCQVHRVCFWPSISSGRPSGTLCMYPATTPVTLTNADGPCPWNLNGPVYVSNASDFTLRYYNSTDCSGVMLANIPPRHEGTITVPQHIRCLRLVG